MVSGRLSMSRTLTSLTDLDHEFRSKAKLFLNSEQREQFNNQMDHIVEMFHAHDKDTTIECYNKSARVDNGQIESAG